MRTLSRDAFLYMYKKRDDIYLSSLALTILFS